MQKPSQNIALTKPETDLFVLSKLRGVGGKTIKGLSENCSLSGSDLIDFAVERDSRIRRAIDVKGALDKAYRDAADDLEKAEEYGVKVVAISSQHYPIALRETPDAPAFIYVMGNLDAVNEKQSIAIIGSRKPTANSEEICRRISNYFAEQGWTIVSGLALGCDTVAHQCAVEARKPTVAVLAHGLQTIAPKENAGLAEQIVATGGALVSEYPMSTKPKAFQYVQRDRIQSGLARGTIMCQSSVTGGGLHATRAALRYSRYAAIPNPTDKDLQMYAESLGANIILAGENRNAKLDLLECSEADLSRLFIIKSRDDYRSLLSILEA